MKELPSLDTHAHLDPARTVDELADSGFVLAMTLSLEQAALVVNRKDPNIVWGVGCHPRKIRSQESFDIDRFRNLVERTALVGEIGLDVGAHYSHASLEKQLETFRKTLKIVSNMPRIVSIHAYQATKFVVRELKENPIEIPILHWWTGNAEETREALALGCYFSIHSAVARHSKFRTTVPSDRILVETDHGQADPPEAIPCRIAWVEHLVAQQFGLARTKVRQLAWRNLARIVRRTQTEKFLPEQFASKMVEACEDTEQWREQKLQQ